MVSQQINKKPRSTYYKMHAAATFHHCSGIGSTRMLFCVQ